MAVAILPSLHDGHDTRILHLVHECACLDGILEDAKRNLVVVGVDIRALVEGGLSECAILDALKQIALLAACKADGVDYAIFRSIVRSNVCVVDEHNANACAANRQLAATAANECFGNKSAIHFYTYLKLNICRAGITPPCV